MSARTSCATDFWTSSGLAFQRGAEALARPLDLFAERLDFCCTRSAVTRPLPERRRLRATPPFRGLATRLPALPLVTVLDRFTRAPQRPCRSGPRHRDSYAPREVGKRATDASRDCPGHFTRDEMVRPSRSSGTSGCLPRECEREACSGAFGPDGAESRSCVSRPSHLASSGTRCQDGAARRANGSLLQREGRPAVARWSAQQPAV